MSNLIADYTDSSGRYRIYLFGSLMLTDFDGEAWTSRLVSVPELDNDPTYADGEPFSWNDYVLDEATGFASNFDDAGESGYVRIGGHAYRVDLDEKGPGVMSGDRASMILEDLGYGDDDTDALSDAGNVVTLPGEFPSIGATELEDDGGSDEFAALAIAFCYKRGNWGQY